MSPFVIEVKRDGLLWFWSVTYTNPWGATELISTGYNLRKRRALLAAQAWQRIAMRSRGLL